MRAFQLKFLTLVMVGSIGFVSTLFAKEPEKKVKIGIARTDVLPDTLDNYYGDRNNTKSYRHQEHNETGEQKDTSRHQWRRIDVYSEED